MGWLRKKKRQFSNAWKNLKDNKFFKKFRKVVTTGLKVWGVISLVAVGAGVMFPKMLAGAPGWLANSIKAVNSANKAILGRTGRMLGISGGQGAAGTAATTGGGITTTQAGAPQLLGGFQGSGGAASGGVGGMIRGAGKAVSNVAKWANKNPGGAALAAQGTGAGLRAIGNYRQQREAHKQYKRNIAGAKGTLDDLLAGGGFRAGAQGPGYETGPEHDTQSYLEEQRRKRRELEERFGIG